MKRKGLLIGLGFIAMLAVAVIFTACNFTGTITIQPVSLTGQVFLASSSGDVSGANVAIVDSTGTTQANATTATDGTWSGPSVDPGVYTVQVTKSGYYFPAVSFTAGSFGSTAPDIPGFLLNVNDNGAVSFVLMWNTTVQDLDLHMTIPKIEYANAQALDGGPTSMTSPSYIPNGPGELGIWGQGFGPGATTTGRWDVNYNATDPFGDGSVTLDHDAKTGVGPETITLRGNVPLLNGFPVTPDATTNKLASDVTQWAGVAVLYIDTTKEYLTKADGSSADAVVYAFQTLVTSGVASASPLGTYRLPDHIAQTTVSVIRVNICDTSFQIVPDIQAQGDHIMKSVSDNPGVINVPRF